MKKHIKRLALTTLTLLALLGAGTGIALASGYIQWGGTADYNETLNILEQIERRSSELGTERTQLIQELVFKENVIKDKDNVIKDKDNQIDSLEQQIEALEKRINDGQTTQDQLQQAEKDMNHVKERSQEVLINLRDSFEK